MVKREDIINFGAGPATLPTQVLKKVQEEFLNYNNTGVSITELGHRSKDFINIVNKAKSDLRQLLDVPEETHDILFMQGGASTQFSAVVLNLVEKYRENLEKPRVDYFITGGWSSKAAEEAKRSNLVNVNIVIDSKSHPSLKGYIGLPPKSEWNLLGNSSTSPAYVYYCDNETVHGVEYPLENPILNAYDESVPLVADISSNILTRRINVRRHAVIIAGAQKNVGAAGVTIVIVRRDILVDLLTSPQMLSYKIMSESNSLYNTPPVFAIYTVHLVLEHLLTTSSITQLESNSTKKSTMIYNIIDTYPNLYIGKVQKEWRSRMNVVFTLPSSELENDFLKQADDLGFKNLKGHRSVGGIRVSLYNAITIENVEKFVTFMQNFAKHHNKQ